MNAPFIVAQATAVSASAGSSQRVIKIAKPQGEHAISLRLDNNARLDLSDIGNEKVTFVHVGDRLVILFDNQATISIAGFFDEAGKPYQDINIAVEGGRVIGGTEFAKLFPIGEDPTILPAAGEAGAARSAANFSDAQVEGFAGRNALGLLSGEAGAGSLSGGGDGAANSVPRIGAIALGNADDEGLSEGNLNGPGDAPGNATQITISLNVDFGQDITGRTLNFAATQPGLAGLFSGGEAISLALTVINGLPALVGYTGLNPADPAHQVFTITLDAGPLAGEYTFTLLKPLDHPVAGTEDTITLSIDFIATDGNGDSANGTFQVAVNDDSPTADTVVVGAVTEDFGGPSTIVDASLEVSWGADRSNTGPGLPGDRSIGFTQTDPAHAEDNVTVSGTSSFPGPLTSNGDLVLYTMVSGVLFGYTDPASGPLFGTPFMGDLDPRVVFEVALSDGGPTDKGSYSFELRQPLDHPAPDGTQHYIELTFDFTAVDSDGDSIPGSFKVNIDANGVITNGGDTIDYSTLTEGVFINLANTAQIGPGVFPGIQIVDGNTATDHDGAAIKVIGIDRLGTAIVNATGGAGDDVIIGGNEANILLGQGGDDTMRGFDGDDTMEGGAGDDFLRGDDGDDTLRGGAGDDILEGNDDNDTLYGGSGWDELYGGSGNDTLYGGRGSDYLDGWTGDDKMYGGRGDDVLLGGAGNDELHGGRGDDLLVGEQGNDFVYGGAGRDELVYQFGYLLGHGIDVWEGGEAGDDYDTATLYGSLLPDFLTLTLTDLEAFTADYAFLPGTEVTASEIERIHLLDIPGGGDSVQVEGLGTSDHIILTSDLNFEGGVGETVIGSFGYENFRIDGNGGADVIDASAYTYGGVDLRGDDGDDEIIGSDQDDVIRGGKGNDDLRGRGGDDLFIYNAGDGQDTVRGGAGDDLQEIYGSNASETFNINKITLGGQQFVGVNITAGVNNAELADDGNFEVATRNVEDIYINTGAGSDTVLVNGSLGGTGLATSTIHIEDGNGNSGDTVDARGLTSDHGIEFIGNGGNDYFYVSGANGDDTFIGGTGTDTIDYRAVGHGVTVDLSNSGAQATGAGDDIIQSVENVVGSDFDDVLTGTNGANVLTGRDGNDTIKGGQGADTIDGGAGTDKALYDEASTAATIAFNGTNWTVTIGGVTDALKGVEKVSFSDGKTFLLVDHAGANVGGYQTIQAAVDAADPADTVLVATGTYNESVTVSEGITIRGVGAVTVDGGNVNTNPAFKILGGGAGQDLVIDNIDVTGNADAVIQVAQTAVYNKITFTNGNVTGGDSFGFFLDRAVNVGGVEISNATFSGNGTVNDPDPGEGPITIFKYNGDVTLKNVTVENPGIGAENGIQISGTDALAPMGDVTFDNVTVTGTYQKTGVLLLRYSDVNGLHFVNTGLYVNVDAGWFGLNVENVGGTVDLNFPVPLNVYNSHPGAANDIAIQSPNATAGLVYTGDASEDLLVGGHGNDTLNGDGGNDVFMYAPGSGVAGTGSGSDGMYGGFGNDTLKITRTVSGTNAYVFAGTANGFTVDIDHVAGPNDTIITQEIEKIDFEMKDGEIARFDGNMAGVTSAVVTGDSGSQILATSFLTSNTQITANLMGGVDWFYGGNHATGVNVDGGDGQDFVTYSNISAAVTIDLAAGTAVRSGVTDIISSFEDAAGGTGNDTIYGTAGTNFIWGFGGNDTIQGRGGDDFIDGGAGDDTIVYNLGDGLDQIDGGTGGETLGDRLIVHGDANAQSFVLNASAIGFDVDVGAAGDVIVTTGIETATLDLAGGTDTLLVNGANSGETITLAGTAASFTIATTNSSLPTTTTVTGAESVTINGNDGNDIIDASGLNVPAGSVAGTVTGPQGASIGFFGEDPGAVTPPVSYVAQTFVAKAGVLSAMNFTLQQPTGVDGVDFRVLLVAWDSGTNKPVAGAPLYESATLTKAPNGGPDSFTVAPNVTLVAGQTYAFVLDAFVALDGVNGVARVSALTTSSEDGSVFANFGLGGNTRDIHFASTWTSASSFDLAYQLTYSQPLAVTLEGGAGQDTITGSTGNDKIFGGADNDTINYAVGTGHDVVDGGTGTDKLNVIGTAGAETYNINAITLNGETHLGINIESGANNNVVATAANYEVATKAVEDIFLVTNGGGDTVNITGSLGGTGLAQSTIHIDTGAGDDTIDISTRSSAHRVVVDGGDNTDSVKLGFLYADGSYEIVFNQNGDVGVRITHTVNGQSVADDFFNIESFVFTDGPRNLDQLFNQAPESVVGTGSGNEDMLVAVTLTAEDPDGNLTGFKITSLPANGTLYLNSDGTGAIADEQIINGISPMTVYFKPDLNWNGTAAFDFAAVDSFNLLTPGVAIVNVAAVNDAPVVTLASELTTAEDTDVVFNAINNNQIKFADVDAGSSSVTATVTLTHGSVYVQNAWKTGTFTLSGTVAQLEQLFDGATFRPDANFNGDATLKISLSDNGNTGSGGSLIDSETLTIHVTGQNDAPDARDDTLNLATGPQANPPARAADDGPNDIDGSQYYNAHGNYGWEYNTSNGHWYKVVDDAGTRVTFAQAMAAAEAAGGYLATITSQAEANFIRDLKTANLALYIGATDSQTEGTWKWVTGPEAGTIFWANGSAVNGAYAPWAAGEPNDAGGIEDAATFPLTGGWNDVPLTTQTGYIIEWSPPTAAERGVVENQSKSFSKNLLLANDTDPDGDTLDILSVQGTTAKGATVSYDAVTGQITFNAATGTYANLPYGQTTTDTFTYTVTDGHGGTDTATATITIVGKNDAPVMTAPGAGEVVEDFYLTAVQGNRIGNGNFEAQNISPWTATGVNPQYTGLVTAGGSNAYSMYTYQTTTPTTLSQSFATTVGVTYDVSLWIANAFSTNNTINVTWNGVTYLAFANYPNSGSYGNFSQYTFQALATTTTSQFGISVVSPSSSVTFDNVSVKAATSETTTGVLNFTDTELADTHTVSATAKGSNYVGTFEALITNTATGDGAGQVTWKFNVPDSAIQNLGAGESVQQVYTVAVKDSSGNIVNQDVTVTIKGTNDAPTLGADTIKLGGYTFTVPGNAGSTPTVAEVESNGVGSPQDIARTAFKIANNANLGNQTLPSITITGGISPKADEDFFRIYLKQGETLYLDVDNTSGNSITGLDTYLILKNAAGDTLTYNDDSSTSTGGSGSAGDGRDSYISYTATSSGYYLIDLESYNNNSTGTYQLQVSIGGFIGDATGSNRVSVADLLANDFDADGDTLTLISVDGSGVSLVDGGTYVDVASGVTSFTYTVTDGYSQQTATVNVQQFGSTVTGTSAHEILVGTSGTDTINAGDGNDTLIGGAGVDTLNGEGGNDIIRGGVGNDIIDGGAGTDYIDFSDATSAVTFTLVQSTSATTPATAVANLGADTYKNIEGVIGSAFDDALTGSGFGDFINGGEGKDTLTGAGGNDVFKFTEIGDANADTITDYAASGGTGDKLDLSALLDATFGTGSVLADFVKLWNDGNGNVKVQVDIDGAAGGANWSDVATLQNYHAAGNQVLVEFENQVHQMTVAA